MDDDKVINIESAKKPILIENKAVGVILSLIVMHLFEMHFNSFGEEFLTWFFSEEQKNVFYKLGLKKEEVDEVLNFLESKYQKWCKEKEVMP